MKFAQPHLLWLLMFIPIIALIAWLMQRHKRKQWQEFVADRLRSRLIQSAPALPRLLSFLSLLLGFICLVLALARPQIEESTQPETTRGSNVVNVLDL